MFIRSMMLMCAIGCVGAGDVADDSTEAVSQNSGGGFNCFNKLNIQVVSCVGSIAILPINVDIKDIRVLNDNELNILSDSLNDLSILDGGILNYSKILNDVEVNLGGVLNYLNVSHNDINVCTTILGGLLCK